MSMAAAAPVERRVFEDAETLARAIAAWMCELALVRPGAFAVCLSGGTTPRRLYEVLADPPIASRFPWRRAHWFWGDERFVPHDHPESNCGMARAALLSRVPAPEENIHPIPTEGLSPEEAARAYERTLERFRGAHARAPGHPLFDVTLLGIGEDGHTASLFPGDPALEEGRRGAVAVHANFRWRITLTRPALESSRDLAFVAAGAAKSAVAARARAGDRSLPAAGIRPVGRLHWFIDRAAAQE